MTEVGQVRGSGSGFWSGSRSGFVVSGFPIPRPGIPVARSRVPRAGSGHRIEDRNDDLGARRMKTTCPLCSTRKAKRACPGVHREICAVCCGTKRLTEIACPPDCPYLATARVHPPAVVMRQQDRDMGFVLPRISDLTEMQYRLFLYVQALVLQHAKATIPSPHDTRRRRCRGDGRGHTGDGRQGHHLRASGAVAAGAAARIGDWSISRRARAARGRAARRASNGTRPPRCDEWSAWRARRRAKCPTKRPPSPAGSCSPPG